MAALKVQRCSTHEQIVIMQDTRWREMVRVSARSPTHRARHRGEGAAGKGGVDVSEEEESAIAVK